LGVVVDGVDVVDGFLSTLNPKILRIVDARSLSDAVSINS